MTWFDGISAPLSQVIAPFFQEILKSADLHKGVKAPSCVATPKTLFLAQKCYGELQIPRIWSQAPFSMVNAVQLLAWLSTHLLPHMDVLGVLRAEPLS